MQLDEFRPKQQLVTEAHDVQRARHPAIDAHTHLGRWLTGWVNRPGTWMVDDPAALLDQMAAHNVHGFVNLDGRWGEELRANLDRFDVAYPGRFATFAHVDWSRLGGEGTHTQVASSLAAQLRDSVAAGAAGVKVWKDLGLEVRDARSSLVLPDDPRLAEVWATAGELGVPIWWHVADPVAFFQPVDGRNENVEVLLARPDWAFGRKGLPAFERLVDALEAVVSAHPETTFVAVHGGCYAENLGWVDRMLSTYPNLSIDIAARLAQLGRQPRATRALILRHPSRVIFGTDEIPHVGSDYPTYFRFLETADESFPHDDDSHPSLGRWMIHGLDLPDEALRQVYAENVLRLLPRLELPS